jgi:hypothetical protein
MTAAMVCPHFRRTGHDEDCAKQSANGAVRHIQTE